VIGLDGFKPINDRLGHEAGDALLVEVGSRLKAQVRCSDVVARVGGDEFVMVVLGLPGEADAARVGEKVLAAFERPFLVCGQTCRVGLTIGYCLAPDDGSDADSLLRCADAAMYAGKYGGRNCIRRGVAAPVA
jgi:diguanylate cyclase (GGDEF)-like protein